MEISQGQLLSKGQYADLKRSFRFDDHTLALCHIAILNAWDMVEESGKRMESFIKIIHGPKEAFTDFFYKN